MRNAISAVTLIILLFVTLPTQAASPNPVQGYTLRQVEGWPVQISDKLMQTQGEQTNNAIRLLAAQIRKVHRSVPEQALNRLGKIPIWFSPRYDGFGPTGEYHPGLGWLKQQGRLPELHRCIEFTNTDRFQQEIKRMPMMLLHELSHAYHDQVLGFDDPEILKAFQRAKASGKYQQVKRGDGKRVRSYALTNHKEYFAEATEAFFGRNDFYPFDREALQTYDPFCFEVLVEKWGPHEGSK